MYFFSDTSAVIVNKHYKQGIYIYKATLTILFFTEAPLELRFIENSPRVIGFTVEANLIIGSKFCSATCSVSTREPVNCKCRIALIKKQLQ